MPDNDLTVLCLADGESTSRAFFVEIDRTKTVAHLKKRMMTENPETFDGVDAKKLTLHRVFVATTDDNKEPPILIDSLITTSKLSYVLEADWQRTLTCQRTQFTSSFSAFRKHRQDHRDWQEKPRGSRRRPFMRTLRIHASFVHSWKATSPSLM
ncbi:MAG: hypothetical protein J3R72DRAFT_496365 [Linnemannia gamsii]|nr:MAG: hypothetical protein J3R72DRAFT_496365 [Linnemannia gamsii]